MAAETIRIEIPIEAKDKTSGGVNSAQKNLSKLDRIMDQMQDKLSRITRGGYNIDIGVHDGATEKIASIEDAAGSIGRAGSVIDLGANDAATGVIAEVEDAAARLNGENSTVEAQADDAATGVLADVQDSVSNLNGETAVVHVEADTSGIDSAMAAGSGGGGGSSFSMLDLAIGGAAAGAAKSGAGYLKAAAAFGGMTLGIGSAVGTFKDFEAGMSQVEAISGATGEQMTQLTAKAQEMGAKTKFTATQSAEAFKYMGMAGWDAEAMLAGIEPIMNLAAASGEDLGTVSDIVTDSMTAFGMTANDTGDYVDILAQAARKSNTDVSMMGESFKYAAPVAGAMGYTASDTAIALGLMANAGIKGSQAGTSLRRALSNLASPSTTTASAMAKYGISLTDSAGQMKSLQELMIDFRSNLGGLSEAEQTAAASDLFGTNAMAGMLAIINAEDEAFNSLIHDIENSSGVASTMADVMMNNLQGSITLLSSAFDGVQMALGERLSPYIQGAVDTLTAAMPGLTEAINTTFDGIDEAFATEGLSGVATEIGNIIGDIATTIGEKGPEAIEEASTFISNLLKSLSSAENADKIGTAAAGVITEFGTSMATVGGDYVVAAGSLIKGLTDALVAEDAGTKIADAVKNAMSDVGKWFGENGGDFGAAAGELIAQLAGGIASNSGELLVAGINIVQGIGEGIIEAGVILVGQAPKIVGDLVNGFIEAIPRFFEAGVAIVSAVIDGIMSLGEAAGQALYDALTMTYEPTAMEDIFNPQMVEAYGQHVDAINDKMVELANTTGNYSLDGWVSELVNGTMSLQEIMDHMSQLDPYDFDYAEMEGDMTNNFIPLMQKAMDDLGITYEQAEQTVEEASTGISEATKKAMDAASEGLADGTSTAKEAMDQEFDGLIEKAQSTGTEVQEALDIDLADSLGGITGDTLTELLSAEDIGAKADEINAAMETVASGLASAGEKMSSAVSESMTAITESLGQAQEAFASFQEAAMAAVSAVQEAMGISVGGSLGSAESTAGSTGTQPSAIETDVEIKAKAVMADVNVQEALQQMKSQVDEVFGPPIPEETPVEDTLNETDDLPSVYGAFFQEVSSRFSEAISVTTPVSITLAYSITNPHASIDIGGSASGSGSLTATVHSASGRYVDGFMVSTLGEDGPEYVIPVGSGYRDRGLTLWEQAGRDLGVPGFADGGFVGGPAPNYSQYLNSGTSGGGTSNNNDIQVNLAPNITVNGAGDAQQVAEEVKRAILSSTDDIAANLGRRMQEAYANMPR